MNQSLTPWQIFECAKRLAFGNVISGSNIRLIIDSEIQLTRARMIMQFELAQKRAVRAVLSLSNEKLRNGDISSTVALINDILDSMETKVKSLAHLYVKSAMVNGRISSRLTSGKRDVSSAFSLDSDNSKRLLEFESRMVGNLKEAIKFTKQSLMVQLNSACVKARTATSVKSDIDISNVFPQKSSVQNASTDDEVADKRTTLPRGLIERFRKSPNKEITRIVGDARNDVNKIRARHAISQSETELVRQKVLASIKNADKNGTVNAQGELITSMMSNGLVAFSDKSGKVWRLNDYCNMIVTTSETQSRNCGELFEDDEHDLYTIPAVNGSCKLCKSFEGKVFSRSGTNGEYPPLSEVFQQFNGDGSDIGTTYLSIHPNCRHKLVKYTDSGKSKAQIAKIKQESNLPPSMPLSKDEKDRIKKYKEHERLVAKEERSEQEYRKLLTVIPIKTLGNWREFWRHYASNDAIYKSWKKEYNEKVQK